MSSLKLTPASGKAAFGSRTKRVSSEPKEQRLFLLEFFVHSISGDRLSKLNQMFFVPTSVSFRFLSFNDDSIEVTPVDPMFEPQAGIADEIEYFYAGRSVVFAIGEDAFENGVIDLTVALIVQKKMPDNIKPDVLVGVSFVDLNSHFADLKTDLQRSFDSNQSPPSQSCEAEYPILFNGEHVGDISLFTRLSGFGQMIVTEFDAPPEKFTKTPVFVFKSEQINDSETQLAYKCRVLDSDDVDLCGIESGDDMMHSNCPVCLPQRFPCLPCGLTFGAVARPTTPGFKEQRSSIQRLSLCSGGPEGTIRSSRGGQQPCGKAVVLKVSGLLDTGDGKKQPTVTVLPESEATGPNNPPDSEHDVFILRIGKKGLVAAGEKSDLQLEMRTPKGPQRRPPIRYETREAQTEAEKDKGKGKKSKGKKGKK